MSEIVKCPECGGAKYVELSRGKCKCQYCGAVFETEVPAAERVEPQPYTAPRPQPADTQTYTLTKVGSRNKIIAALLAFFLGGFGGQYFYLGKIGAGVLCLLFCWTFIPSIIAFIDIIRFLVMSDKEFDLKYNMA